MGVSLILEKGIIPNHTFYGEEYKIHDRPYTHTQVSKFFHKYIPSATEIYNYFERNNIAYKHIYSRSDESVNVYQEAISNIKDSVSEAEYQKYLVNVIKKLYFLGNDESDVFKAINEKEIIDELILNFLIDKAKEEIVTKPYVPQKKIVTFNPEFYFSSLHKLKIQRTEIANYNAKMVLNECKSKTIEEIATNCNLSSRTVIRHLQNKKMSTKGNKKERTINSIKAFKKSNPSATQKECSKKLGLSIRTIKSYWKHK